MTTSDELSEIIASLSGSAERIGALKFTRYLMNVESLPADARIIIANEIVAWRKNHEINNQ